MLTHPFGSEATLQELLAFRFLVGGASYQQVLDDTIRWMAVRAGATQVQAHAGERASHHVQADGRELRLAAWPAHADQDLDGAAELVLVHPDVAAPRLTWRTQVDLVASGDETQVTVRLGREATSFFVQPTQYSLHTPGLVRDLVQAYDCSAGGVQLCGEAVDVGAPQVDGLAEVISSETRVLPVMLLTSRTGHRDAIAARLLGLAHVYVLRAHAVDLLPEVAGDGVNFDPDGAMLVWPRPLPEGGFDRWFGRDDCRSAARFADRVFDMLSRLSSVSIPRDRRFALLRDADARQRLAEAAAGGADAEDYRMLAEDYMRTAEEASAQVSDLEQRVAGLSAALAARSEPWTKRAQDPGEAVDGLLTDPSHIAVTDWDRFIHYATALSDDVFVIQPEALASLRKCPYPNPQRMWDHLVRLKRLAEDYRTGGVISGRLKEHALSQHGIEIALQDKGISSTTVHEGRTLKTVRHVKVDDVKKFKECGRIYFAMDNEGGCFVVDHIGLHR